MTLRPCDRLDYLFLIPVVPDVLHIVILFHNVDELFHQLDVLFALQLLIVLGNHFNLGGNEGVQNRKISNFLADFVIVPEFGENLTNNHCFADIYHNSATTYIIAYG